MAFYTNRDAVKSALQIPASTTGEATGQRALLNQDIDAAIEGISQLIEDYLGYSPAPTSGTRFYTPTNSTRLCLDYPLLALDSVQISSDGGTTYGTTFATDSYHLAPYNATMESPPRPFWEIELRESGATAVFNKGIRRSARITGTWGYFDQRAGTSATLTSALDTTTTGFAITGATSLHPGQLILMGTERMTITQTPASATGAHTSAVNVLRAQHGTVATSHSAATGLEIYEFPIIERAALYQACQDYRVQQAPMGYVGGEVGDVQRPVMRGGLHPFTRRLLDPMRKPVTA